ncbi:hypothetical protein [Chryseosolibacter indicus]|uniref:Uncharacterized protein n=1 Tax=Chryseosolibacter indicus TaxID=2782351 RepID=A0ABS5VYE6_9BACT|nr:hypothetical protein [Chryseosolibacter indicus]MBT1706427.1 hypothetical protein [Chryseosolibacter indicus]
MTLYVGRTKKSPSAKAQDYLVSLAVEEYNIFHYSTKMVGIRNGDVAISFVLPHR